MEDFQTTSDTEDFSASILSSLDIKFESNDYTIPVKSLDRRISTPHTVLSHKTSNLSLSNLNPSVSTPISNSQETIKEVIVNEKQVNAEVLFDFFFMIIRQAAWLTFKNF